MSDMRLIVAGAGGRMGRTLIHAIAATDGVILSGAVEAASSAVIGRDAGELAGLGRNGVTIATDVGPLLAHTLTSLLTIEVKKPLILPETVSRKDEPVDTTPVAAVPRGPGLYGRVRSARGAL